MKARSFWTVLFSFWILCFNTLFGAPIVTSVTPFVGPSSGGTFVTVTGSGFTGATSVQFGEKTGISLLVESDNTLTVFSPRHSPEAVFVTVTTPEGTSANTCAAYFVYQGNWEAYVTNVFSNDVSVINTTTQTVVATIPVGQNPQGIAITPDGTQTYVPNPSGLNPSISAIDNANHIVIATIPVVGGSPFDVAITPDGLQAYVTTLGSNNVIVIDTITQTVIGTISVGISPTGIAITPDGSLAYVTNSGSMSVSVIDISGQNVIATINVGINPSQVAITPDGTQAYVVNANSNTVSVIDIATQTVIDTILVVPTPFDVAITPDGTEAFVTGSNLVSVIDTTTREVIATMPVSGAGIAITPDGALAYVANFTGDTVSVIDIATRQVIATIPAESDGPFAIAITPDQAPLARFTVTIAPAGLPSTFDASQSVSPVGTIVNYFWDFGDGTTLNTSDPVVFHTYASPGNYTVTLIVTNSAGTSTQQIYSPPSIIINGGPSAIKMRTITIPSLVPIVQRISPSSGTTCGDTLVTITGVNFTGATAVFFGSTPAVRFTVRSDTTITAISPPGSPGTVDITVVTPFGTSAITAADRFTYLPPSPPKDLRARQVKNRFATQTDVINILCWKAPSRECAPVAYRIYRDSALTRLVAEVSACNRLKLIDHNRKEGKTYTYFIVSVDRFGNVSLPAIVVIKGCH